MSKRNRNTKTPIDFDIGIGEIIPSTQQAFKEDSFSKVVRIEEKTSVKVFKQNFLGRLKIALKDTSQFPTYEIYN